MTALASELRKWTTVFSVYMQDNLMYRSQAVIWMMTDTVPAVLMPLVWLASYNGRPAIGGYSPTRMVGYYLAMLCLTHLMVTHIMWDMATEIREGRFAVYLTRPFSYLAFQYAGNLSWRLMRAVLFIPVFGVCALIFRSYLHWEGYHLGWSFWAAVLTGHLLSFFIGYAMGLLALFFTEVRSIYMFYYLPMSFLSGEVVPLSLLPPWAKQASDLLPFRYTLGFAIDVFQNRLTPA
ncbi:MAG TPA: ABC-2 family transporter protein, partial [Armatimonadota bacterium]|nr:ABC-2 family transporter protein [Armatimonadota bacterium]